MEERFFTTRAIDGGQPDKTADVIADAILDEYLVLDSEARTDIKVVVTRNSVHVYGEVQSVKEPNIEKVVRQTLKEIGYEDHESGLDPYKCSVELYLQKQSQDIARSLHPREGDSIASSELGIVYGYATNEETNYLPFGYNFANKLIERLDFVRKSDVIEGLLPDSQVSVTMEYFHDEPQRIATIIMNCHHKTGVDLAWLRMEIMEKVIDNVCKKGIDKNTKILLNSGGRFIIGGPTADIGISGRKVENESYGGFSRYGGLSFSGKDPLKINRTMALAARHAAINIISKKMADKIELYVGYAFGVVEPICMDVETFGTGMYDDQEILDYVNINYNLELTDVLKGFNLQKPIYKDLALNGYWGKENMAWEKTLI